MTAHVCNLAYSVFPQLALDAQRPLVDCWNPQIVVVIRDI